jgi:predicted Zn-dependent protease
MCLLTGALVACQSASTLTRDEALGVDRRSPEPVLLSQGRIEASAARIHRGVIEQARQQGTLDADPALTARVQALAARLIAVSAAVHAPPLEWAWQVHVIRSDRLDAWCLPGGLIVVHSGLLTDLALTDAELAVLLAHDMAHALRGHAREQAQARVVASQPVSARAAADTPPTPDALLDRWLDPGDDSLPNSRAFEAEADRIGLELAARAGFDPRAALSLAQKMEQGAGTGRPAWLVNHPPTADQRARLEALAARLMPLHDQAAGR